MATLTALLRYGDFVMWNVSVPSTMRELRVPKPQPPLTLHRYQEHGDVALAAPIPTLVFRYHGQIDKDLVEYVFEREE